jgi:polyisoprenoid-binding protein YceI
MRAWKPGIVFAIAAFGIPAAHAADEYVIDPAHSSIAFSVRHMGLSSVRGTFHDFTGSIFANEADVTQSTVGVTIKTASIDTDNAKRDEHLRSADFFEAEKYPEISFRTSKIVKDGEKLTAVGTLVMHGTTRVVEIPFEVVGRQEDPSGKVRVGIEGKTTINRQDFGINFGKVLDNGALMVGNDVKVELNIEAIKK